MLRATKLTSLLASAVLAALFLPACGSSDTTTPADPGCAPSTELCNGVDDNCNGQIDENVTEPCTDNGASGTRECTNGQWGECETTCTPALETCNGKDDDCDGTADEADDGQPLKRDCSNSCGTGTEVCAGGQFTSCTAAQPKDEECNGVDDDCDGNVDDGFDCAKGEQGSCGTDIGACELGTRVCGATCEWGNCVGGVTADTEACDGVNDEDCDGTVDNGCGCTNGETKECCGGTEITCAGGTWPSCPAPPTETCNGIDDDCNGDVDDKLPVSPFQLEEDISGSNDCAHAKPITTPVAEDADAVTQTGYLYKPDLSADSDFFAFQATEDSDWDCVFEPLWYECYTVKVKLTPPAGTAYQLCVYDLGYEASGATCAAPEQKTCSTAGSNEVVVEFEGDCGLEDTRFFYVEVKPGAGDEPSCKPYTLSIESLYNEPQETTCAL